MSVRPSQLFVGNLFFVISKSISLSRTNLTIIFSIGIVLLLFTIFSPSSSHAQITHKELHLGEPAPEFSLTDPEKGKINKETFSGKPLFIFFTTTWCTPCQIGAQNLAKFDDENNGNAFNVLAVFVDEKETDNQFIDWKQKFGRQDWYISKGIEMAEAFNVKVLDTKYVFDKNGIIKWIDITPLEYSTISPVLSPLL